MYTWKMNCAETDSAAWENDAHRFFEETLAAGKQAVILESGNGGWTFVGIVNEEIKVPSGEEGLIFMREFVRRNFKPKKIGEAPFTAGFVGFLSYDLGAKWNNIIALSLRAKRSNLVIASSSVIASEAKQSSPEAYFVYVDKVVAFKHVVKGRGLRPRPQAAPKTTPKITPQLAPQIHLAPQPYPLPQAAPQSIPQLQSNLTADQYFEKIRTIKNYLYSGDTYQVNFSQRFQVPYEIPYDGGAWQLYKTVTAINPSPFQFFIETPEFAVISNSPERLFKINQKIIETRPIKGTMPRGKTPAETQANLKKLLSSPKERAELAMIVDLERNDLGKICMPGTIEVTENRTVEFYSHVLHTVANICGALSDGYDWFDALKALFPGGSVTGCPKKRTMEIIAELEGMPRGVYCGSAGYIDLSGDCDFNIMIRTLFLEKNTNGRKLTFHSGGGIVVDSDPEREYEETLHKANALISGIYATTSKYSLSSGSKLRSSAAKTAESAAIAISKSH